MKEYGIYIRQYSGKPYMIHFYNDIDIAKFELYDMISLEEERGRPYYVDNDFFNNTYNMSTKLKYFCIKEREVSEWEDYSETNEKQENKIVFFQNFKSIGLQ